jgi:hypothetical protein
MPDGAALAPPPPTSTDVLVVGAGPAGSSAAAWAARRGLDVVLADAAVFPRDKACGDGLTPRAIAELELLGLGDWVRARGTNRGLRGDRVRTGAGAALAGRVAARSRRGGPAHRAGRPDPGRRAQGRRGPAGGCPSRRRGARRRPGRRRGVRPRRRAAHRVLRAPGRRRRRPVDAGPGCSAGSGTRTPRSGSPRAATSAPGAATTRGSPRTWSCAASRTRCWPATAGCSRWPTARSTSGSARWPPPGARPGCG